MDALRDTKIRNVKPADGTFPRVVFKAACEKRHDTEELLDQGQDPATAREAKRQDDWKFVALIPPVTLTQRFREARSGH